MLVMLVMPVMPVMLVMLVMPVMPVMRDQRMSMLAFLVVVRYSLFFHLQNTSKPDNIEIQSFINTNLFIYCKPPGVHFIKGFMPV